LATVSRKIIKKVRVRRKTKEEIMIPTAGLQFVVNVNTMWFKFRFGRIPYAGDAAGHVVKSEFNCNGRLLVRHLTCDNPKERNGTSTKSCGR